MSWDIAGDGARFLGDGLEVQKEQNFHDGGMQKDGQKDGQIEVREWVELKRRL